MKLPFINAGTAGTIKPGEITLSMDALPERATEQAEVVDPSKVTLRDIHNDFDSASERILENAKEVLAKAICEAWIQKHK